ncbi:MAG: AzlC family ABC transporter permease [Pseudomonadota bacterium]
MSTQSDSPPDHEPPSPADDGNARPADATLHATLASWVPTATRATAFRHGLMAAISVPGCVLMTTSLGFGALARDAELFLAQALFLAAVLYALPAQVILVDQISRDATLWMAAFAVSLTAIRLLPMTVTLVPYFRGDPGGLWLKVLAVHFVAVTAWVESRKWLPTLPPDLRLPFFLGLGFGFLGVTLTGTAAGYALAGSVSPAIVAALLLSTPIYFLLSLLGSMKDRADGVAIALGAVGGPLFHSVTPQLDLMCAGLVGGTAAWLVFGRRR